jgi:PAS domain S-box-containing protein
LKAIPEGVIAADAQGQVVFLNPVAEGFLGWTSAAAAGRPLAEIYPIQRIEEPIPGAPACRGEIRVGSGPWRVVEERTSPLPTEPGGRAGQVIVFRDITNQLKTEAELLRVRQIESLGVLAGGIAHDFNNYLSAILGNISLAKQDLPADSRASTRLAEAMRATDRARSLSLKLLTFAKGGDPARRVVDLVPLVREATEFVTHGTGVLFTCTFEPGLWNAEVDDGLISQVIHNLVINAVQAMQGQGHIHLRLENLKVGRGEVPNLKPGRYLRVSLQDTGPGIPESVLPRIFEPYFTTKNAGNGLGLASCFNIMRAHEGGITAESPEGGGARFTLFVPATERALAPRPATYVTPMPAGRGSVLVMEDDPVLQEVAAEMLERTGFSARTCPDGEAAIQLYSQSLQAGSPYTAVIMDLTIPGGMGGREAAGRILALHPEARLIVSSGYSVDPVLARPTDYGFRGVLTKPYGLADLARVMDEVSLAHS